MMRRKRDGGPRKKITGKKVSSCARAFAVAAFALSACMPIAEDVQRENEYPDYSNQDCRIGNTERPWESIREPYLEYSQDGDITDDCHSEAYRRVVSENVCTPMDLLHTLKSYSEGYRLDFYGDDILQCIFYAEHERNGQTVPNTLWNNNEEQLTRILSEHLSIGSEVSYWLVDILYETTKEDYHPIARQVSNRLLWDAFENGPTELRSYAATKLWSLGNRGDRVQEALLDGLAFGEHPFITDMFAASRIYIDAECAVRLIKAGVPEPAALVVLTRQAEQEMSIPSAMDWALRIEELSDLAIENPNLLPETVDLLATLYRYQGEAEESAQRHLRYHRGWRLSGIDSDLFLRYYHEDLERTAPNRLSVIASLETILQSGIVQRGSETEDRILQVLVSALSDSSEDVARLARCTLANS